MSAKPLDIEFSVVSGSREELLLECIASVYRVMAESPFTWAMTATCNTPGNGLAARLRSRFRDIRTIENVVPRGFAANHNVVLSSSVARYVWLLNDDLVMLADSIDDITKYMDAPENRRVAVVSPRLLNPDGSLQPSTYSFSSMPQTLLAHSGIREHRMTESLVGALAPLLRPRAGSSRYWKHDRTMEVETFRGACVAVRMQAVREVGPMTEVALVGGEEVEWHYRFRRAGWKIVFFAETSVVHHGSQTVDHASQQHLPEYLKGTLYFFRTSKPRLTYTIFCGLLLGLFSARFGVSRIRRDPNGVNVASRYLRVAWDALRV